MWRLLLVGALCFAEEYTVESQGFAWTVHAWAPKNAGAPVVFVFHGAGGGGKIYLERNGWLDAAKANGFAVIAPDGLPARPRIEAGFLTNPRLWNGGNLNAASPRARIDDAQFFDALLDDAAWRFQIDRKRVFVTGHSNGAALSFLLAAKRQAKIAAIAPVASLPYVDAVKLAMPTLWIIGKKDPLVPYDGGESALPWGKRTTPPVEPALFKWAKANGCDAESDRTSKDGIERRRYCEVFEAVIIDDQGHGWPGGTAAGLRPNLIGPATKKYDATREIWNFFSRAAAKPR
jgi:polyhydroxybutyrate depolymerase